MQFSRGGKLLAVLAVVLVVGLTPHFALFLRDLRGSSFPDALLALGSLLTLGLAGWVLLVAGLVSIGASSRTVARLSPALLRTLLLAGAASALAIGPAQATQIVSPGSLPHSVSGLPLPDRPDSRTTAVRPSTPQTVEVRSGDTLWAIASGSLAADATDAQIAAATRAWHRTNLDVIGADPHLIFPTQRLTPPTVKDLP